MTSCIQTEGLVKTYGERSVVDGVNVRFGAGEVVGGDAKGCFRG